jgi:FKBP-type peptidyl-prolyl cis-trans isomerase SlyD
MSEEKIHFLKKGNYSRITRDKVIRLKYLITDTDNEETLEFRDDLYYLHGGYGGAFPLVEQALEGHEVGDKVEVLTPCEDAFGRVSQELRIKVPLKELPAEAAREGMTLEGESAEGKAIPFRVIAIENGFALLDGNHPFAGRNLRFVLEVLDIRDASTEELAAGHAFRL